MRERIVGVKKRGPPGGGRGLRGKQHDFLISRCYRRSRSSKHNRSSLSVEEVKKWRFLPSPYRSAFSLPIALAPQQRYRYDHA